MINYDEMNAIAKKVTDATEDEAVEIVSQLKHNYLLGVVAMVSTEYGRHKKVCEEGDQCDFCHQMALWVDEEAYRLRVELHANIIINLAMNGDGDKWPFVDDQLKERINQIVPQMKASMARGDVMGTLSISDKPPKDKAH